MRYFQIVNLSLKRIDIVLSNQKSSQENTQGM